MSDSDIIIRTRVIPVKPRSKNYPAGAVVAPVGGNSGGSTIISGGSGVDIIKTNDVRSLTDRNVFSSLRALLEIKSRIIALTDTETKYTDENTFSSLHIVKKIDSAINNLLEDLKDLYLSKTSPDETEFLIKLLGGLIVDNGLDVTKGISTDTLAATTTTTQILNILDKLTAKDASFSGNVSSADYAEKLLGWLITDAGAIDAKSLRLREFLEVPELRYNRVSIVSGEEWNAPGGGIIEAVDEENGIIYLKLEPGETAQVEKDDICKATFNNETGFQTAYFRITEKLGDSTFKYVLRSGYAFHPCKAMHFVAYGNFTDEERQKSSYSTQNYVRYLTGVNNWDITKEMIAMQLGDLSNLKLFGIDMTGHSAYLRNIYMTGVIKQISDDGVTESRVPCFKGEWTAGTYYYYDEVTHNGSSWLCISDKPTAQEPAEDATDWLEKSAAGKDAVVINIMSSNGNIFQNGSVSTTLTAYVIKGDRDITDNVPASRFSWEKESSNKDTDQIFKETHVGHGHVLTLTPADVWGRATFNCIVSL